MSNALYRCSVCNNLRTAVYDNGSQQVCAQCRNQRNNGYVGQAVEGTRVQAGDSIYQLSQNGVSEVRVRPDGTVGPRDLSQVVAPDAVRRPMYTAVERTNGDGTRIQEFFDEGNLQVGSRFFNQETRSWSTPYRTEGRNFDRLRVPPIPNANQNRQYLLVTVGYQWIELQKFHAADSWHFTNGIYSHRNAAMDRVVALRQGGFQADWSDFYYVNPPRAARLRRRDDSWVFQVQTDSRTDVWHTDVIFGSEQWARRFAEHVRSFNMHTVDIAPVEAIQRGERYIIRINHDRWRLYLTDGMNEVLMGAYSSYEEVIRNANLRLAEGHRVFEEHPNPNGGTDEIEHIAGDRPATANVSRDTIERINEITRQVLSSGHPFFSGAGEFVSHQSIVQPAPAISPERGKRKFRKE